MLHFANEIAHNSAARLYRAKAMLNHSSATLNTIAD